MELDLFAIRKLSPAGLWDLARITALISTLLAVTRCGFCDAATVRLSGQMLKQYRRELRERTLENFNKRVKAWVMLCPDRIAHVRGVIGEVAIKKWRKNRLLDYAFTQAFGDWKAAFPNGLRHQHKTPKRVMTPRVIREFRTYVWKPFALVKIPNAERILFGRASSNSAHDQEAEDMCAAYLKLWDVDLADASWRKKCTQPRKPRTVKPVRFKPDDLVADATMGVPAERIDETQITKLTNVEPEVITPLKSVRHTARNNAAKLGLENKPP